MSDIRSKPETSAKKRKVMLANHTDVVQVPLDQGGYGDELREKFVATTAWSINKRYMPEAMEFQKQNMDKCKSLQTIPDQFKSSATVARVFHFNGSSSSDESDESDGQSSDGQSDDVDDGADKDGGDENGELDTNSLPESIECVFHFTNSSLLGLIKYFTKTDVRQQIKQNLKPYTDVYDLMPQTFALEAFYGNIGNSKRSPDESSYTENGRKVLGERNDNINAKAGRASDSYITAPSNPIEQSCSEGASTDAQGTLSVEQRQAEEALQKKKRESYINTLKKKTNSLLKAKEKQRSSKSKTSTSASTEVSRGKGGGKNINSKSTTARNSYLAPESLFEDSSASEAYPTRKRKGAASKLSSSTSGSNGKKAKGRGGSTSSHRVTDQQAPPSDLDEAVPSDSSSGSEYDHDD